MATRPQFEINGIIDTGNSVLDNLNTIANASGCFLTWDPNQGQWSVVLNTTGTSVKSFDDSNILGSITFGGSGLTEMYNSVSVSYPNTDTRNTVDVIELEIDSADRYPQELDNKLEISLPIVNNPVQAQYIAARELKQSRIDSVIEFRSNFEANILKAGDLIDVTNSALDFSAKIFRVIQVEELDDDDGNLIYSITAQDYDPDIYTVDDLSYEYRTNFNGIESKVFNAEIAANDDVDFGNQMGRLLAANLLTGLLRSFFTADEETGEVLTQGIEFADKPTQELMEAGAKRPNLAHNDGTTNLCSGIANVLPLEFETECDSCFLNTPNYTYQYIISGLTQSEIDIDLEGEITCTGSTGSLTFTATVAEEKAFTVTVGGNTTNYNVSPAPTIYATNVTASSTTITEGDTIASVTVTTTGIADGQTINYAITGTAADKVTSPTSGTVTINSNTGTLSDITTSDDSTYNEAEDLVITFTVTDEPIDYCGVSVNSVTITVNNNDTTGPIPADQEEASDYFCEFVEVPLIYCGRFDNVNQYCKSVDVLKTIRLPVAPVGGTAVPLTVSVTNGGTSSAAISIDSTVNVEPSGIGASGFTVEVITAFDPLPSGGDTLITGTTSTMQGY